MQLQKEKLLLAGILMPAIYFAALFTAGALYPDYSHMRQVPSDLGADGAPYDWTLAFNMGLVLVGLTGTAGALGLFQGIRKLGGGSILSLATSIAVILPSVNMVMSGLFPLPSPWHSNLYIVLVGNLTPLFGALALRTVPDTATVRLPLLIAFGINVAITGVILGVGDLVTADNIGLWIRIWAVAVLPAIGFLCWAVRSRL